MSGCELCTRPLREHNGVWFCGWCGWEPPGQDGCELCDVGPEDDCSMDCPSREAGWTLPLSDAARLSQPTASIRSNSTTHEETP